jgi:hypothetical protein
MLKSVLDFLMGYESYQPENIVIRYVIVVSSRLSSRRFQFSLTDFSLVYRSAFAQIFPRSQPMRESNTSTTRFAVPALALLVFEKRKSREISENPSVTVLPSYSRVALESCLEIRLECNLTPREN